MMDQLKHFTVGGHRVELSRKIVEGKLRRALAEPIQKHAVRVNGSWYPVKQAIELRRTSPGPTSSAQRLDAWFRALGFEVKP